MDRKLENPPKKYSLMIIGFQKKLDRGVGGWIELYLNFFWMYGISFNLARPLISKQIVKKIYIISQSEHLNSSVVIEMLINSRGDAH